MATKGDVMETWPDFEQLTLDDHPRSHNRAGRSNELDARKQFSREATDKGKSGESNKQDGVEDGTIDIAIRQALMDPKERHTVLRIEEQVERFINDKGQEELEFPHNFSNYQRMLAHRVSQYYGLQTSVKDGFQEGPGRVVAKKTEHMRLPQIKLADLKSSPHSRGGSDRGSGPKVLQRRAGSSDGLKPTHSVNSSTPSPSLSMRAREEDYNEARERIGLGRNGDVSSSSGGGKSRQLQPPSTNGTARPPQQNNGARNSQRKAVIRDKEKELMDPDYRREMHRFNPRMDMYPPGQAPPMYGMPGFANESSMSKPPASPTSSTNSHMFRPDFHQWSSSSSSGFRPPPPPPPQSANSPKTFIPGMSPHHPVPMPRPMVYAPYPAMAAGMHFTPGMAVPPPGMSPQGMYPHPNMHMAYPMMPGYFMPPGQEGMHMPGMHMYPAFNPAAFHGYPHGAHPSMPRAPMPMGMPMMMGMPGQYHMDLAHGMPGFGMDRGPGGHGSRQYSKDGGGNHASSARNNEDGEGNSKGHGGRQYNKDGGDGSHPSSSRNHADGEGNPKGNSNSSGNHSKNHSIASHHQSNANGNSSS